MDSNDDVLQRIRHSLAHVLAQAVMAMRPGAKLGFGPAVEDGFYYDFILPEPITDKDFPEIERRMRRILASHQSFEQESLDGESALIRLDSLDQPFKRQHALELLRDEKQISFYRSGDFVDMCDGPHVSSTSEIPEDCFQLKGIAGAYWRGHSDNPMMTRISAWAFSSRSDLRAHLEALEEAAQRDHKKLGKELEIFSFDEEIGRGLPLWLPNGTAIRDELEKLMKELEFEDGFQPVVTPHIARQELYQRTGHLPYYADGMFPFMDSSTGEAKQFLCLRPMTCPHHHKIFAARKRSYRELPLRLSEYGQVYRYEDSGSLSGLLRVRGLCINDGHIYCSKEQIAEECARVLAMHRRVYALLGLKQWNVRLSTHAAHDKFVHNPKAWKEAEDLLRQALFASGLPFVEGPGEAAFYGPKIDFQFRMVTGREETASTLQLDFVMAERLNLAYVGKDGGEHRPYILHRAPLGTHERFVAILLEHFGGAFPTWLAPIQVRVIPVSDRFRGYGQSVVSALRSKHIRAELDDSDGGFNWKIRNAALRKIPNVLVVGQREEAQSQVTLRRHGRPDQITLPRAQFMESLVQEIAERKGCP